MVAELEKIIAGSKRMVFFGGAGVSTESGIPDFRSVDGLYHQKYAYPPEEIDVTNTEAGTAPKAGDLTIYAPWGNLALFYQDYSYSSSLVPLGSVEEGAEYMADLDGTIRAELK